MLDDSFTYTMTEIEEDTWNTFKEVVKKFLGNIKDPLYKEIVRNMLDKFKLLGCNMNLKLYFLASHLDYCWSIARDDPSREYSRTSRTHKFYGKRKRATEEF